MFFDDEPHGVFLLIDNKSFYASCEAVARGLNPLKVPLVVLSEAENTNGGLILATSPEAKHLFHLKANVSRKRDLPNDPRLWVVPPRMNLYIQRNLQINQIFHQFTTEKEVWPYSIDESILDMTHTWRLFGNSVREVARLIQKTVRQKLGLYTTVGIGDNPVQAKLALDLYAKHNHELIGEIHYETVPDKIWSINELTDVWGIGPRMAKRLNRLQIHNMYELAHTNPYLLKQQLGVIGSQLFATAWGIDRAQVTETTKVKEASLGNSQVLPRDYFNQVERVCTRISDRNIRELIYPKGVLKMTYSRNRYDQDFKKNAVRLSFNSSKPVKIIASELGVPESALYRWRKLYTEDGKQTPFASLEAENRALKRENAELALERDMLKKAAAYFASLQK